MANGNREIRPLHLAVAVVAMVLGLGGAMWGMIEVHAQKPHAGAVTDSEMALIRQLIESEHAAIRRDINGLSADVKDLKRTVEKMR